VTDADGRPLARYPAEDLRSVAIADDGRVAAGGPAAVHAWDPSGRPTLHADTAKPVPAVLLLPDGGTVAAVGVTEDTAGEGLIRFDATGAQVGWLELGHPVEDLALAPGGSALRYAGHDRKGRASGSPGGYVGTVDLATFALGAAEPGPGPAIYSLAWAPDGTFAAAAVDGSIAVRPPGGAFATVAGSGGIGVDRFALGGRLIVDARESGEVRLIDTRGRMPLALLPVRAIRQRSVAVHPDGRVVVGSSGGTVTSWAVDDRTGALRSGLYGGDTWPSRLAYAPDGRQVVSDEGAIRIYDAGTGDPVAELGSDDLVGFGATGSELYVTHDGSVARIDPAGGRTGPALAGSWRRAAVRSRGRVLLLGEDGAVVDRDPVTGGDAGVFPGPYEHVAAVPAGRWAVFTGPSDTVTVADLETGELAVLPVTIVPTSATSPELAWDGTTVAVPIADRGVEVWDLRGRVLVGRFTDPTGIRRFALASDGARIALGLGDRTVRVAEVRTGRILADLVGHRNRIWALAFAPDGGDLVTSSYDGDVRAWDPSVLERPAAALEDALAARWGHRLVGATVVPAP
jgi:WD40 repeat protein